MSEDKKTKNDRVNEIILVDSETGTRYTLDFNLDSVSFLQDRGFDWDAITSKSAIMIPMLFWGAFRRYHKNMSKAQTDKILENMGGMSEDIMVRLGELWEQTISQLVQDEEKSKNSKWTVEL